MSTIRQLFAGLSVALLLTACGGGNKDISGGGTDNGGSGSTETATLAITSLSCTDATAGTGCTSTIRLPAEKTNRVEVELKDAKGKAISDSTIALTSTKGTISPDSVLTDANGLAVFTIDAPAANTSGAGTLTASYTDSSSTTVTKTLDFQFIPGSTSSDTYQLTAKLMACSDISNQSTCSEASNLPADKPNLIIATLMDPSGVPVQDAIISATATLGSISPAATRLTDSEGMATFQLSSNSSSSNAAGTVTLSTTVDSNTLSVGKNYQFGADNLVISMTADTTSLAAGNVAVLTVNVTQNGNPYSSPVAISFTSPCAAQGKATLDSSVTAQQGTAIATYKGTTDSYACSGNDTVVATAAGIDGSATVTISNQGAAARSITAATPAPEFIYLHNSGKNEKSTITFTLLDAQAKPMSGKVLNFSLSSNLSNNTKYSDYVLSPLSATTNNDGQATVTLNAGNLPIPVSVIATMADDNTIRSASSQIGVGVGVADDNSFSFAADSYNINGAGYDGEEAAITIRLADRFNNPVPDGTKVVLTTEGGSIKGDLTSSTGDATNTCTSKGGVCTATLTSQSPRTADGRITVTAQVIGEESFKDLNGTGIFDKGKLTDVADDQTISDVPDYVHNYTDVGEPFMNKNVDDDSSSDADTDGYRVNVDTFYDLNGNEKRDLGDNVYTGLVCDSDTIARGFCKRDMLTLFRNVEFVFTGVGSSAAGHGDMPIQVLINGQWVTNGVIDLTDGKPKYVRVLPMFIATNALGDQSERLKNPIPDSLGDSSNFGDLESHVDLRGINPVPAGSTLTTSNDNGGTVKSVGLATGNCSGDATTAYPSTTRPQFYCFRIDPETTANKKTSGTLDITISTTGTHKDSLTSSVAVVDAG